MKNKTSSYKKSVEIMDTDTGDEPATVSQLSHIDTLSDMVGEKMGTSGDLTKTQATEKIEELQKIRTEKNREINQ